MHEESIFCDWDYIPDYSLSNDLLAVTDHRFNAILFQEKYF